MFKDNFVQYQEMLDIFYENKNVCENLQWKERKYLNIFYKRQIFYKKTKF